MRVFVPEFRELLPLRNTRLLGSEMVEIEYSDLSKVMSHWKWLDNQAQDYVGRPDIRTLFNQSVGDVLGKDLPKETLRPFLRRPHVTVHAGASSGNAECKEVLLQSAFESGFHVGKNNFSLWYGGGDKGMMGEVKKGFEEALATFGRKPGQYSVQVTPAAFATPKMESVNGLRPPNESICQTSDVAIIVPDFNVRRELLDSRCEVGLTNAGAFGTTNEFTDIATYIKTGLSNAHLYAINPYIPKLKHRYYKHFIAQCYDMVSCGLLSADTMERIKFMPTAERVFQSLMPKLKKVHRLPDQHYRMQCERDCHEQEVRRAAGIAECLRPSPALRSLPANVATARAAEASRAQNTLTMQ